MECEPTRMPSSSRKCVQVSTQARSPIPTCRIPVTSSSTSDRSAALLTAAAFSSVASRRDMGGEHHAVGAVLEDAEDDLRLLDVGDLGDDAAVRVGRGGEHDLQRDLGGVAEVQQAPPVVARGATGVVEAVGVGDLHEPAELHIGVPLRQLGRLTVPGRLDDDQVGGCQLLRQRLVLREQHLLHRRGKRLQVGRIGRHDGVHPLVDGLLDDGLLGTVDVSDVQPAQLHGYLLGEGQKVSGRKGKPVVDAVPVRDVPCLVHQPRDGGRHPAGLVGLEDVASHGHSGRTAAQRVRHIGQHALRCRPSAGRRRR